MKLGNWQCRLYGHAWRHPGEHEVVLSRANGPVYPIVCGHCQTDGFQAPSGERFDPDDAAPSIHEQSPEPTE